MIIGIPVECFEGERRVAITPGAIKSLTKAELSVLVEPGAGQAAGYTDSEYEQAGASLAADRDDLFARAAVICQVRSAGASGEPGRADLDRLGPGKTVIGLCEPLAEAEAAREIAERGAMLFSMELIPRITRAQSMDVLSSQASIAGYKAAILAADTLQKIFPMMMTAAGTITPAKVFVIGAGVAGLQAVATAKRLGAVVSATDVRPAVKEQVESLGGKFVFLEEIMAEGEGGYAGELTDEQKAKQQQLIADVVAESDIVITTAAIPGRKAPVLVTQEMVERMSRGAVVVDMAAERGGNCALTEAGQAVEHEGVTILGPANIPSTVAYHASQTYARNITTFLLHLVEGGAFTLDMEDQITADTLVARDGQVVHPKVREILGMEPLSKPEPAAGEASVSTGPPPAVASGSADGETAGDQGTNRDSTEAADSKAGESADDGDSSEPDPQQPDSGRKESS